MVDRWIPDLSELTDMALQINMRMGSHHVSRSMSPTRSVTPPGWPSRPGRPQVPDASGKSDSHPSCATPGCPCTSTFNGKLGEACCRTCQRGTPCASNYHPHPMERGRPHGRRVPGRADTPLTYPHCVSPGCPCTSTFNGEPGEPCFPAGPAVMACCVLQTSTRDRSLAPAVQQPCHRRRQHPYPQDTPNCSPQVWANATVT